MIKAGLQHTIFYLASAIPFGVGAIYFGIFFQGGEGVDTGGALLISSIVALVGSAMYLIGLVGVKYLLRSGVPHKNYLGLSGLFGILYTLLFLIPGVEFYGSLVYIISPLVFALLLHLIAHYRGNMKGKMKTSPPVSET